MGKYKVTMILREYYELEIEADSYGKAFDIAGDTDISDFNETNIVTEQLEIEEIK